MKTKIIITLSLWLCLISSYSQLFQKFYGQTTYYYHDICTDQLQVGSENLIIAGNSFETNYSNPKANLFNIENSTGNIIWQRSYFDPQGVYDDVRVLDIVAYVDVNGNNSLALTGSVNIAGQNHLFIALVDEFGDLLYAKYYINVTSTGIHSQGLTLIHTLNGPLGRGFDVGGFSNADYDESTSDDHMGFVMYAGENDLNPLWTVNIKSAVGVPSFEYDMISDITETDQGYFITGSIGAIGSLFLQQAVLCLGIDYDGNTRWANAYRVGNSRDVGVDAFYDEVTQEIYLLANYSYTHYFGVTVINDYSGNIEPTKSWYAYNWNDLNWYGFKILEPVENMSSSLVIAGYIRNGEYLDYNGNLVQAQTLPFVYEFDRSSGDQMSVNYFYHVPYQDPGFPDCFNFWDAQMPLIYYTEMAIGLNDNTGYFITGYRGGLTAYQTFIEAIKTDQMYNNLCYHTPISISHDSLPFIPVDFEILNVNPDFVQFSLATSQDSYFYELSCQNTAVTDQPAESMIETYPNPVNALLYVSIPKPGDISYLIYNSEGKIIGEGKLIKDKSLVDIRSLSPGLYYIRLLIDDYFITKKILIE